MQHPGKRRWVGSTVLALSMAVAAAPAYADAKWNGLEKFSAEESRTTPNFDGLYGRYTVKAVERFQAALHLPVNGIAGPETLKALGLPATRPLKSGMGGHDVLVLQQALLKKGYWTVSNAKPVAKATVAPVKKTTPAPAATPSPAPTPLPSAEPTPEPSAMPTAAPEEEPTASPVPASEGQPENLPTLELWGTNWMLPLNATSLNYDIGFRRPTWSSGASLWMGDIGVGASVLNFNETYSGTSTTPLFKSDAKMIDGLIKMRFDHGYYQTFAGYRTITGGDFGFATLGGGMERPLYSNWLWLEGRAQVGHNLKSAYFADADLGLGLRANNLELSLGFREFLLQNGANPLFTSNGPVGGVKVVF